MPDRIQIARHAAEKLRRHKSAFADAPVMVGFDGFVDSIIAVVDKRHSLDSYTPVRTIEQFGQKILAAAGKSSNYEFDVRLEKLGGNGPIMANALLEAGLPVTYIGALGYPSVHPVFADFASRVDCRSISNPGFTDAVEFEDGKLMLGKHATIRDVGVDRIDDVIGAAEFAQIIERSRFIGMVNWTMLVHTNGIWRRLIDAVLPACRERKLVFVDLADPEKRTTEDLLEALHLLSAMQDHADVMLGVNLKESAQVAAALDIAGHGTADEIEPLARALREKLGLHAVVIHPRETAAAAVLVDGEVASSMMTGAFTRTPKLSTGAGDNFNAGFCMGMLAGCDVAEALCVGNAASGYYVRNAGSAGLDALVAFLHDLPEPE